MERLVCNSWYWQDGIRKCAYQGLTSCAFPNNCGMVEPIGVNNLNTWQLCPKCLGMDQIGGYVCPVCNNERIISSINGLPPSKQK